MSIFPLGTPKRGAAPAQVDPIDRARTRAHYEGMLAELQREAATDVNA